MGYRIISCWFCPCISFGIALGNVLQGVPFYFDPMMHAFYMGTFLGLLNPFALFCGLVSVFMLIMHGGVFLSIKTSSIIQKHAKSAAIVAAIMTLILFAACGYIVIYYIKGYQLASVVAHDGPSNPLFKHVVMQTGAWMNNLYANHTLLIAQACAFGGILLTILFLSFNCSVIAWITSALSISGIITTVGVSMFPFILPSSLNPNMSLTVWDASSSQLTLLIMLIATIIFLPIILIYTLWVYRVMRGKVTDDYIKQNQNNVY